MTDEEREDVLQLLANYENMARAVEILIHRLKLDADFNSAASRYRVQPATRHTSRDREE